MKRFLKDNRGVSLMELIVVTLILVILASATGYSVRMFSNKIATQCAENIKVSLEKHKTSVMGKKNGRIAFFKDGDGNIWMQEEFDYDPSAAFSADTSKATKIGKAGVEVYYNGTAITTAPTLVEFNRSGALKSSTADIKFKVERTTKKYEITIEHITGKISMKSL